MSNVYEFDYEVFRKCSILFEYRVGYLNLIHAMFIQLVI